MPSSPLTSKPASSTGRFIQVEHPEPAASRDFENELCFLSHRDPDVSSSATPFDQATAACRCEWGTAGIDALAPADVIIVVDVLSFTTCVDVATGRGAAILPYAWNDATAVEFASRQSAELALKRGLGRYSLSPASYLEVPSDLRCVLPSPNGAVVALRAAQTASAVLVGCLRNAGAIAAAAGRLGATVNVCPAGERWRDGTLRPALEDLVAAGPILLQLQGSKSPEAEAAIAAFERWRNDLARCLAESGSGREMLGRGHAVDIEIAAAYDVSAHVPLLHGNAFRMAAA